MKLKININFFISIILFHSIILKLYYFDYNYNLVSFGLLGIVLIYLSTKYKIIFSNHNKWINLFLIVISFFMLCSSLINMYNLDGTILYIMRINTLFWFFEYVASTGNIRQVSKTFFFLSLIYLIMTYYYILMDPLMAWKNNLYYLIGSKFYVSYIALFSISMFLYTYDESIKNHLTMKIIVILLFIFSYILISRVKCSTGLVGLILLVLLICGKKCFEKRIHKFYIFLTVTIISSSILLLFNKIINIPAISNFITNVLSRDITLTGRTIVYGSIFGYLKKSMLLGYGYNSVYNLFNNTMKIGNQTYALDAQNAILEYILYFGIIGVFLLFLFIYFIFLKYKGKVKLTNEYYFFAFLYVLIILGMAEITINMLFFTTLAFIYCLKNEKKEIE